MGRPELIDLNRKLKVALQAVTRRPEVLRQLGELESEITALEASERHHAEAARAELADVDRLDGVGGLLERLTGTWQQRVDREVREALDARERLATVSARLGAARAQRDGLRAAATQLADADEVLATMLARKERAVRQIGHPDVEALERADEAVAEARDRVDALGGALRSGLGVIAALGELSRDLTEMRGLNFLDALDVGRLVAARQWWASRDTDRSVAVLSQRCHEFAAAVERLGGEWRPPGEVARVAVRFGLEQFLSEIEDVVAPIARVLSGDVFGAMFTEPMHARTERVGQMADSLRADVGGWVEWLSGQHRTAVEDHARAEAERQERLVRMA